MDFLVTMSVFRPVALLYCIRFRRSSTRHSSVFPKPMSSPTSLDCCEASFLTASSWKWYSVRPFARVIVIAHHLHPLEDGVFDTTSLVHVEHKLHALFVVKVA